MFRSTVIAGKDINITLIIKDGDCSDERYNKSSLSTELSVTVKLKLYLLVGFSQGKKFFQGCYSDRIFLPYILLPLRTLFPTEWDAIRDLFTVLCLKEIEDIIWPRRDAKFLFKVWKVLNTSERSKMGNTLFNCSQITTGHVRVKGTKFPSKMASHSQKGTTLANICMCNQMVTWEMDFDETRAKLFPNFTSIPFDYLLISWVTNCVSNLGFLTCLSWIVSIESSCTLSNV